MNWARVKTILIVVFLIVNIFLVVKIVNKNGPQRLSQGEIENIKQLLSKNNITLKTQLPASIYFMRRIEVTNNVADMDGLADKLIGKSNWTKKKPHQTEILYVGENKELKIKKNGIFEYKINQGVVNILSEAADSVIKEYLNNILKSYITSTEHYQLDSISRNLDGYDVKLKYVFKGIEIFNNDIQAKIYKSGQIVITQGLVSFSGFAGKPKKVSPVDALVKLIEVVDSNTPTEINKISLGYFATVTRNDEIIKYEEAEPAWKIETSKGTYIFNGYYGNLVYKY